MSDYDRALLLAFCRHFDLGSLRQTAPEMVDEFLAAGELAERSALQNTLTDDCPKCGKPWTGVYMRDEDTIMCLCSRCGGLNLVPTTAAPTGKRFWSVGPMLGSPGRWLCVEVFPNGSHRQMGQPRSTREAAEADGRASGLPEWKTDKPTTAT